MQSQPNRNAKVPKIINGMLEHYLLPMAGKCLTCGKVPEASHMHVTFGYGVYSFYCSAECCPCGRGAARKATAGTA